MIDLDLIYSLLTEEFAVIPLNEAKEPTLAKGSKWFSERIPEDDTKLITKLFTNVKKIGIKGGDISCGFEGIDFDDHDGKHGIDKIWHKFTADPFVDSLITSGRVVTQKTMSGGYHFLYRYESEKYEGNQKLALWSDGDTMVETRGQGGYLAVHPSPGYKLMTGDFFSLDTLDKDERDTLIQIAKQFTEKSQKKDTESVNQDYNVEETDPVSWYNAAKRAHAKNLLEDKGWQKVDVKDGVERWRRPAKDDGISATWGFKQNAFYVYSTNAEPFKVGVWYSPFQIMLKTMFSGEFQEAVKWIEEKYFGKKRKPEEKKYVRIGVKYFKKIETKDRYGIVRTTLRDWNKEEIKLDHGLPFLKAIRKFDAFCMVPDNINYREVHDNHYNLYAPIPWEPKEGDLKWTNQLMNHIFGEQLELGWKYMQMLYLHPDHMNKILCLVSEERNTGKTTFLNWINNIFGDNCNVISPKDLESQFNDFYATKTYICIDETKIKNEEIMNKLKTAATAKNMYVNAKFVSGYKIPSYMKLIINSNDESAFVNIDEEEDRFWVRKVPMIAEENRNTNYDECLVDEIPALLYKLKQMPKIDFSKDRSGFTLNEIENETLRKVKKESKSILQKEIEGIIEQVFYEMEMKNIDDDYFFAAPVDFFQPNPTDNNLGVNKNKFSNVDISKVLRDKMKFKDANSTIRYDPFRRRDWVEMALVSKKEIATKTGRPYKIVKGR